MSIWTHLLHKTKELSQEDLRGFYESIGEGTNVRIVTRGFQYNYYKSFVTTLLLLKSNTCIFLNLFISSFWFKAFHLFSAEIAGCYETGSR